MRFKEGDELAEKRGKHRQWTEGILGQVSGLFVRVTRLIKQPFVVRHTGPPLPSLVDQEVPAWLSTGCSSRIITADRHAGFIIVQSLTGVGVRRTRCVSS